MMRSLSIVLLCLYVSGQVAIATAQPVDQGQSPPVTTSADSSSVPKARPAENAFNAHDHTDWGSYYDPQNVFCGKYDCYKILGFDYEEFGKEKPDTKVITKRYRSLSREWHPDKSKHKDAKERFVVRPILGFTFSRMVATPLYLQIEHEHAKYEMLH
jgi:DnaJ domain